MPLSPFTLIGGANNVGKTSVLESLFLLYGHRSPLVFQQLRSFRNVRESASEARDLWENIFFNYDPNQSITVSAVRDNNNETLEVCRDDTCDIAGEITKLPNDVHITPNSLGFSYPLKIMYTYGKKKTEFHLALNKEDIGTSILTKGHKENLSNVNTFPVVNFSSDRLQNTPYLYDLIGRLNRNKQKDKIVSVLKDIDKRVQDIVLGEKQQVYLDIAGLAEMIPLTSMGTGISNVLYWTATATK